MRQLCQQQPLLEMVKALYTVLVEFTVNLPQTRNTDLVEMHRPLHTVQAVAGLAAIALRPTMLLAVKVEAVELAHT
jgi:hypothetical protein